jgi:hypothetical protein
MRYTPKKKLSIQVTNIDGVHVDYMNILEAGESKVCKDFTAQAARSYNEDLALVPEKIFDLTAVERE